MKDFLNRHLCHSIKYTRIVLLSACAWLATGCASPAKNPQDPFESFNRGVYHFNDTLDRVALKPVASAYNAVAPAPVKKGVSNFFSNLNDLLTTFNDLLQFKFAEAASDGSRFLFNSTFGVFGLFDVAHRLEKREEDFGQTLGHWGIGPGPYLMLPLFGPSTLRDSIGMYTDSHIAVINNIDHVPTRNQLYFGKVIDTRNRLLDKEKLLDDAAVDRYAFIRDTYLQYRQNLVYDGDPPRPPKKPEDDEAKGEITPFPTLKGEVPAPRIPLVQVQPETEVIAPEQGITEPTQENEAIGKEKSAEMRSVRDVWVAQREGFR